MSEPEDEFLRQSRERAETFARVFGTPDGYRVLRYLARDVLMASRTPGQDGRRELVIEIFRMVLSGRGRDTGLDSVLNLIGECTRA